MPDIDFCTCYVGPGRCSNPSVEWYCDDVFGKTHARCREHAVSPQTKSIALVTMLTRAEAEVAFVMES